MGCCFNGLKRGAAGTSNGPEKGLLLQCCGEGSCNGGTVAPISLGKGMFWG